MTELCRVALPSFWVFQLKEHQETVKDRLRLCREKLRTQVTTDEFHLLWDRELQDQCERVAKVFDALTSRSASIEKEKKLGKSREEH